MTFTNHFSCKWFSLSLVALFALMLQGTTAVGQPLQYDANCNKRDYSDYEKLQQEICSGHLGCKLVMIAEKACKVKDFLGSLGGLLGPRSSIDNYDVADALNRLEVPQTPGVQQVNASVRDLGRQSRLPSYDRSNAAQVGDWAGFYGSTPADAPRGFLNQGSGGFLSWFEGKEFNQPGQSRHGQGTLIDSKGSIEAGSWSNGKRESMGLKRNGDGTWAGGVWQGGVQSGPGYSTRLDDGGQTPVMEGSYLNGKPDGEMVVTWPDFSSRREIWRDGKMIAFGQRVPRGQTPPPAKTPEQLAAEKLAAEESAFAQSLSLIRNAGELYALGDEWAEKGNSARARAAWRELVKRYPDSPFALRAADRLAGGGSVVTSTSAAQTSPGSPLPPYKCTGQPSEAFKAFDAEFARWNSSNPVNPNWGMRDTYQFSYYMGTEGLRILARYKGCMSDADYQANFTALDGARNNGLAGCRQTSNDGGRNCVAAYPGR